MKHSSMELLLGSWLSVIFEDRIYKNVGIISRIARNAWQTTPIVNWSYDYDSFQSIQPESMATYDINLIDVSDEFTDAQKILFNVYANRFSGLMHTLGAVSMEDLLGYEATRYIQLEILNIQIGSNSFFPENRSFAEMKVRIESELMLESELPEYVREKIVALKVKERLMKSGGK